jgi:hypothetical protein
MASSASLFTGTDAARVKLWAEATFPDDFAALRKPNRYPTALLKFPRTLGSTSIPLALQPPESGRTSSGDIIVRVFLRDGSLSAAQLRNKRVIHVSPLLQWLEEHGSGYLEIFAACLTDDNGSPTPGQVALEIEATMRYYLASKGVRYALNPDDQMFRHHFERACRRARKKLDEESESAPKLVVEYLLTNCRFQRIELRHTQFVEGLSFVLTAEEGRSRVTQYR